MNFDGFDLNLLVAFNALMLERNVTKAAALAGVSQPAMSAALARLRRVFDDPLFIRSAEGLLPTAKAQEMAISVADALGQVCHLMKPAEDFDPNDKQRSFTLGLTEYPLHVLLPALTKKLATLAPNCTIHVRYFIDRDEVVALLDAGKIDIAVGVPPTKAENRILSQPLLRDDFVTLVGSDHPIAQKEMNLQAFLSLPHILVSPEGNRYGLVDQKLREQGLARNISLTLPTMFTVPDLLPDTDYVATVLSRVATTSAHQDRFVMFEPPLALSSIPFDLLWHRRTQDSSAHRWLRGVISDVGSSL
ncbi:LysR family transcriptional regulator (plasmid) [Pseudomonas silvicola]|nr:LysR family transcriptional regulator [Pseudomonas silvicola]